jgi:hypothetical protein
LSYLPLEKGFHGLGGNLGGRVVYMVKRKKEKEKEFDLYAYPKKSKSKRLLLICGKKRGRGSSRFFLLHLEPVVL